MDKNQIFGFILIFAVVIGWSLYTSPTPEELARQKAEQDSIAALQVLEEEVNIADLEVVLTEESTPIVSDSINLIMSQQKLGAFAPSAQEEEKTFTLENEKVRLTFNSKGGFISRAELKDHVVSIDKDTGEDTEQKPLVFLSDEEDKFEIILPVNGAANNQVSTNDLIFAGRQSGNKLTFKANTMNGGAVSYIYTLQDNSYALDFDIKFDNVGGVINNGGTPLLMKWLNHLEKLERGVDFEKRYSTIYFKESDQGDPDYCSCMGDAEEDLREKKIDWISHSNQFFNVSLIGRDKPFESGYFVTQMTELEDEDLKVLTSTLGLPYSGGQETFAMQMYVGPNDYGNLAAYDQELEQIIPFGRSIFGSINRHIIRPAFEFLSNYVGSKGIVIIILIFVLKSILYPLMYKMLSSQAKMSALKPELADLKEKFKDEPQKLQMEQMKVYQSYGVSPFGGCFPMLLQMPIWYALFRFFPASITFRQEPFLWAQDLSSYDDFFHLGFNIPFIGSHLSLFTILWAVSMLAYTHYNTKHMDMTANPAMKYVQYLMPLMFLGFFNNYASGLTCYMLFSNLINIIQTVGTKKLLFDEEKILADLKEKKANAPAKKKGGFQARMEKLLEEQKKIAAQQQQGKKKKRR